MEIFYRPGEIMSIAAVQARLHIRIKRSGDTPMIITTLKRALLDWAARPVPAHHNENALWRLSSHDLADLPFGPEPEDEGSAFEAPKCLEALKTCRS